MGPCPFTRDAPMPYPCLAIFEAMGPMVVHPFRNVARALVMVSFLAFAPRGFVQAFPPFAGGPYSAATGDPLLDQAASDLAALGIVYTPDAAINAGPVDGTVGLTEWNASGGKNVTIDTNWVYKMYPGASVLELLAILQFVLFHEHEHCEGPDSLGGIATAESLCKECRIAAKSAAHLCYAIGQGYSVVGCRGVKLLCTSYNDQTRTDNETIGACLRAGCSGVASYIPTCEIGEECSPY